MEMCNICKIKAPLNLSFINSNLNGVFVMVRETGLEPVRHKHTPLKRACLPIPALALNKKYYTIIFTFVNVFLYAAGKSAAISSSAPYVDIPPRPCYNRHA